MFLVALSEYDQVLVESDNEVGLVTYVSIMLPASWLIELRLSCYFGCSMNKKEEEWLIHLDMIIIIGSQSSSVFI